MRAIIAVVALLLTACAGESTPAGPPGPIEVVKPTATAPFDGTFSWKPVRGATGYRLVVFNGAGERSFEVPDVHSTSVALAKNVGLPAASYSWQVIALNATEELTKSEVTKFEIR